ncbi:hypothetical protein NA57DRAFT_77190 [Rhizodiscina lignyota]|uniref:Uncharacterized protein n=1 Tax=Rhizodiscina lignyota TaxID=1504668 RepID=A0A9P4M8I9_9PEZI|nr:hypothetical protein NA57DRAFT_77190 [Rhizodiscina lignyota]
MPAPDANAYAPGIPRSEYGFQGNQDIYGVGIRAGYYTQAFAVWTANFFVPHEAPFLHSVNIMFMIAMLVGLVFLVDDPENTWAVEPFMLLNITYSIAWIGTCSPVLSDALPWESTLKDGLVRQVSFLGLDGFAAWYWFIGLPKMKPTVGDLGTMVYWWNQGPLFGWVRVANQVVTVMSIVFRFIDMGCRGMVEYQQHKLRRELTVESLKEHAKYWMPLSQPEKSIIEFSRPEPCCEKKDRESQDASMTNDCEIEPCIPSASSRNRSEKSLGSQLKEFERRDTEATLVMDKLNDKDIVVQELAISPTTPTLSPTSTFPITVQSTISRQPTFSVPPVSHNGKLVYHPSLSELNRANDFFNLIISANKRWPWYCDFMLFWYYLAAIVPLFLYDVLSGNFHPRLMIPIMQYINAQPNVVWHHGVRTICSILRHPPAHKASIDWRALTLLVRFKLTLDPPAPFTKGRKLLVMWHGLSFGIMLAIGTELTIQWNYIKGIQSLGSVGQLIPMALGVGGLVKVIWGAFVGDEEWCGKQCAVKLRKMKWRDVALMWVEANEAWAREREKVQQYRAAGDQFPEKKETV